MGSYRRSRRWLIHLAQLLSISSTTSAVSLQDFQVITILQVPSLSCLSAYGSTIRGCARSDFERGVQCPAGCAKGILDDQANVIAACQNVDVLNPNSLLGLTLQGGLLNALCPGFQNTPVTVTTTVQPSTRHTFLTPSQSQTTEISTTTTADSTTESPSTTEALTTTSSSTEILTTIESTASDVDISTTILSSTEAPSPATTASDTPPDTTQASDNPKKPPGRGSSGGGSPFDPVFFNGSERTIEMSIHFVGALTGVLITMFLI